MDQKLNRSQKKLAVRLFNIQAIEFGYFELKLHEIFPGAPLSPIKINLGTLENKKGRLTDDPAEDVSKQILVSVEEAGIKFDLVAGIPRKAERFAEVIARLTGKPLLKLGKKIEGGKRKIDSIIAGEYHPRQKVLLIDDLITWADTKKEAIKVCEEAGLLIAGIAVFIDREQGGFKELERMNYNVCAAFKLSALLKYYLESGRITPEKFREITDYITENQFK
jgi:orotate phosphoribosyltransferase